MRPPFRSASFPSLRQWGALLPPKKAKRLQRGCTSLRSSCWPLDFVGKCSLAPLARSGSVVSLRSPPSAFRSLRSFSAAALPALALLRPTALQAFDLRSQFRSLRSFVSPFHSEKISGIFEKKERSRRTHIFPENVMFGFCSASATQKHESKQILYITSL